MKFVILAVAGVGLIVLAWAAVGLFTSLDKEMSRAREVSDKVAAAVMTDWGKSTFASLATPEFVTAQASGKYDPSRYLSLLGPMHSFEPCVVEGLQIENWNGWSRWQCSAKFQSSEAKLVISLILGGGQWRLSDFAVLL